MAPTAVLSDAFGLFLPTLFVCYVLWRCAFRWVLPSFRHVNVNGTNALSLGAGVGGRAVDGGRKLITLVLERSVYYLGPFWVGVLMNVGCYLFLLRVILLLSLWF